MYPNEHWGYTEAGILERKHGIQNEQEQDNITCHHFARAIFPVFIVFLQQQIQLFRIGVLSR